jgi:hypothetical protein
MWPILKECSLAGDGGSVYKASSRAVPYQILRRRASDVAACYADLGKALRGVGLADAARSFGCVRERLEIPEL